MENTNEDNKALIPIEKNKENLFIWFINKFQWHGHRYIVYFNINIYYWEFVLYDKHKISNVRFFQCKFQN